MKIDLNWIQKELDAGREVILVNIETGEEHEATKVVAREDLPDGFKIAAHGLSCHRAYILDDDLEYFRIKRPDPTFEDLITEVVKAYESGLVSIVRMGRDRSRGGSLVFCKDKNSAFKVTYEDMANHGELIEYIKSLYTETFVINSVDDLRRIVVGADGVLSNGSKFKVDNVSTINLDWVNVRFDGSKSPSPETLGIEVLKGATVTQKRGEQ